MPDPMLRVRLRAEVESCEDALAADAANSPRGREPEPGDPWMEWLTMARAALDDARATDDEMRELLDHARTLGDRIRGGEVDAAVPVVPAASRRKRDPEDKAARLVAAWLKDGDLIGASNGAIARATGLKSGTISRLVALMADEPETTAGGRLARAHEAAKRERAERAATPRRPAPDRRSASTRARSRDGADREALGGRP